MSRALVWDLPTRVFHWLLAASFAGAFLTSDSEKLVDVHVTLGYTMLGLVGFRLLWGLAGTRYARFRSFAFGPAEVVRYLWSAAARRPRHYLGHNPAGSWAIFVLLALTVLTGVSGYLTFNDLGGEVLEGLHEGLANAMVAAVAVHVGGVILSSLLHRENLAKRMLSGYKAGDPALGISRAHWLLGLGLAGAVAGYWASAL
jgi:cytochrome b